MNFLDELDTMPGAFGVPHPTWRDSQLKALNGAFATLNDNEKFMFSELPTGSGKSAIATALGSKAQVLVLVQTLSLLDQYEAAYDFAIVKGKASYECVNPEKVFSWKQHYGTIPLVSNCHFSPMSDCPVADQCLYIKAREKALASRRMACTYKFGSLSQKVLRRSGIIVLDEAHAAGEELLSLNEVMIDERDRWKYDLPPFPFFRNFGPDGRGDVMTKVERTKIVDWLMESLRIVRADRHRLARDFSDVLDHEKVTGIGIFLNKLEHLLEQIDKVEWYMNAGPTAIESYKRKRGKWTTHHIPGLFMRPLSARVIAGKLWEHKQMVYLMSATIGEPKPLAIELGIDKYRFESYEHPIPKECRPVHDLKMQRMTWKNTERWPQLYKIQAIQIAKFIKQWPDDWRGLILTSSFRKIEQLFKHLKPHLEDRLEGDHPGTDINEWIELRRPGAIAINTMQGWGHGIDLYGDKARILIMASVPFKSADDPFEKARKRLKYSANYAWWSSYIAVPQA